MSDSDEIVSSGEESYHDTDNEDYNEQTASSVAESIDVLSSGRPSRDVTIDDSEEEDADGSIKGIRRCFTRKNKRPTVIDSSSDNDDDNSEDRALSPPTRMSITGIRPSDLDNESSEIDYSTEDDSKNVNFSYNDNKTESVQENNRQSVENIMGYSLDEGENKDFVIPCLEKDHKIITDTIDETNSCKDESDTEKDSKEYFRNSSSPINNERFVSAIKDKLSSTMQPETPEKEKSIVNNDSDVVIIDHKEKTIELLSSDENTEQNKENIKTNGIQKQNISQINKNTKESSKLPMQYVSEDFYNKELRKLESLKSELLSAEHLYQKIATSLPDGGHQLLLRIEHLRNDNFIKSNYIASLCVEDSNFFKSDNQSVNLIKIKDSPSEKFKQLQELRRASNNDGTPDWDELSAAVNDIKPKYTGKQGMATFNTQKALIVDCLKDLHGSLENCPDENVLADDPEGLKVKLMLHQKHALAWMYWREKKIPRGGILADDMGLGKTLTIISLVLSYKNRQIKENIKNESPSDEEEEEETRPWTSKGIRNYYHGGTLVVCPASLVRQWEAESHSKVSRHKLTVCVHHGNNRDTKPKHLRTYDIVVTTYNIVAREHKNKSVLFDIKWKRIILDEAHVIRNHKSQSSIAVCDLKGKYRWALTGTPIQNKEMDVYALMKFLHCSPFDDLAYWKKWIDKSAGGQQRLNTIMKSLMLRRTKIQLQERGELQCLPEKNIQLIQVELAKDEMNVYQKVMVYSRTLFAQFLFQRAERNTDIMYREQSSRPTFMQTKDPNGAYYKLHQKFTKLHHVKKEIKSHEILVLLLRLRQICCHPGLIDSMLEDNESQHMDSYSESDQSEINLLEQLNKLTIKDAHESNDTDNNKSGNDSLEREEEVIAKASARVLQRSNPVFDLKRPSSKILKVLETLKQNVLTTDDKAIVVSQWTSVLDILRKHLENQGISTLSLNGRVPVKLRQDIVTEFNNHTSKKRILLLSLTAGGVGLNLIGANHLMLIDLHWNPQLEAQAQDRIYRVGQLKKVNIYKFMCKDTIEERIRALQEHKMSLAKGILTGVKSTEGSKLTMDDLKNLFEL